MRTVTVVVTDSTANNMGGITAKAPTVSGYKFLSWIAFASQNWVGGPYAQTPTNATTNLWNGGSKTSSHISSAKVLCVALYIRQ